MVTDRELREATAMRGGSPKPPSGIVKSMCRLYNGSSSSMESKRLNRSSSFSAAMNKELEISCNGSTGSSGNPSSTDSSPEVPEGGKKPRGLFRSWSQKLSASSSSGKKEAAAAAEVPKRCSPSCGSTKSADSGFSDSGESNNGAKTSKVVNVDEAVNEAAEKAVPKAVDSAVGNISSLQEGLRMKREQCEETSMVSNPGGINRSGSNLLKAGDLISEEDKAKKQFYFSEIRRRYQEEERLRLRRNMTVVESAADISRLSEFGMEDGAAPAFSTPVRASFRSRRPRTSIEGARTPSKVDSRIRLREKKARSLERHLQNRWVVK